MALARRTQGDVESWEDVGVLAWGSSSDFSRLNRLIILKFLEEGRITGKVLLALNKAELVQLNALPFGAASELITAVDALRAEIGARGRFCCRERLPTLCLSTHFDWRRRGEARCWKRFCDFG